jgi:cytochrome P450
MTTVEAIGRPAPPALPAGPPLPVLLQTILNWGHFGEHWRAACQRRYGDVFKVEDAVDGPTVYVADPAILKEVFTGSPAVFHAGAGNRVLEPVLGKRSVLLTDEQEHLWRRKLMLPMFHGDAVRAYADTVLAVTEESIDAWPLGRRFALHPRMRALTFEVILRAVIGVREPERLEQFRIAMPALAEVGDVEMWMWLWPALSRVGPWRRYARRQRTADALLRDEIRARRADGATRERRDILSLLIAARTDDGEPLDEDDLRDQLVTLLLAGHETTATGLAWAFECLLRNPPVLARAVEAAHNDDDAYLDAVVNETLRLRPVIPAVARKLAQPARVGGHDLPAGIVVSPAISLIHHDERVYESPQTFDPERFLTERPPSYGWIPFGGGTRRCLGAAFAQLEMRLVLRSVLRRAVLRPARRRPDAVRPRHITLVPSRGVQVVLEAR